METPSWAGECRTPTNKPSDTAPVTSRPCGRSLKQARISISAFLASPFAVCCWKVPPSPVSPVMGNSLTLMHPLLLPLRPYPANVHWLSSGRLAKAFYPYGDSGLKPPPTPWGRRAGGGEDRPPLPPLHNRVQAGVCEPLTAAFPISLTAPLRSGVIARSPL